MCRVEVESGTIANDMASSPPPHIQKKIRKLNPRNNNIGEDTVYSTDFVSSFLLSSK
jgi:hypothetical protein